MQMPVADFMSVVHQSQKTLAEVHDKTWFKTDCLAMKTGLTTERYNSASIEAREFLI